MDELKKYVRYGTESYPCSVIQIPASAQNPRPAVNRIHYVDNVDMMKLKVEFKGGYAVVDSHYFSLYPEDICKLEDWDDLQCVKVYYRRKTGNEKLSDVLMKITQVMGV